MDGWMDGWLPFSPLSLYCSVMQEHVILEEPLMDSGLEVHLRQMALLEREQAEFEAQRRRDKRTSGRVPPGEDVEEMEEEAPKSLVEAIPPSKRPHYIYLVFPLSFFLGLAASVGGLEKRWRDPLALFLGSLMGLTASHAHFKFSEHYRDLFSDTRGYGVRSQVVLLFVACPLFSLLLFLGRRDIIVFQYPVSLSVVLGSFVFGIGMQVADFCTLSILFQLGEGNVRALVALITYLVASTFGAFQYSFWVHHLPHGGSVFLLDDTGIFIALLIQFTSLGILAGIPTVLERRKHGMLQMAGIISEQGYYKGFMLKALFGYWPAWTGAILFAVLSFLIYVATDTPWGITSGVILWGSSFLEACGTNIEQWHFWKLEQHKDALDHSILSDSFSLTSIGILIGACTASLLAGRFYSTEGLSKRILASTILGVMLMGYGAAISNGGIIEGFVSGVSSFSVHGWIWFFSCLVGNYVGMSLRPLLGLEVEKPSWELYVMDNRGKMMRRGRERQLPTTEEPDLNDGDAEQPAK